MWTWLKVVLKVGLTLQSHLKGSKTYGANVDTLLTCDRKQQTNQKNHSRAEAPEVICI